MSDDDITLVEFYIKKSNKILNEWIEIEQILENFKCIYDEYFVGDNFFTSQYQRFIILLYIQCTNTTSSYNK